jgi:hypothetical protein
MFHFFLFSKLFVLSGKGGGRNTRCGPYLLYGACLCLKSNRTKQHRVNRSDLYINQESPLIAAELRVMFENPVTVFSTGSRRAAGVVPRRAAQYGGGRGDPAAARLQLDDRAALPSCQPPHRAGGRQLHPADLHRLCRLHDTGVCRPLQVGDQGICSIQLEYPTYFTEPVLVGVRNPTTVYLLPKWRVL